MSRKILVVDDDENIQRLLKVNLEKSGYEVSVASNGNEGLQKFEAVKPDLLIVDIVMPGMDGYHFCWDIIFEDGLYAFPVPKIIVLTGRDKKLDRGISDKIGVDAYITKPFDVRYLVDKVTELLSGNAIVEQKKIMIIDDDPNVEKIIKANLPPAKYKATYASNGEEGLEMIELEKPDLVILDLVMPKKTGYEVCSMLKRNPVTAKIPVIMLTAKKEYRDKYIGTVFLKADEYVTKPFEIKDLLEKIEKLTLYNNQVVEKV
jgi:DNA-binding response OmpR family regulator